MKIALHEGLIICADCGPYFEHLRSTGRFRWDRRSKTMRGDICYISLKALNECCNLPPNVRAEYERLKSIQEAMELQRKSEQPKLLIPVPVKNCELMRHQIVGVNMALLLFGAAKGGDMP